MAIGSLNAVFSAKAKKDRTSRKTPEQQTPPGPLENKTISNIMDIRILLVGRNLPELTDLIAAVHADMNPAVSDRGLAFFSEDNVTIREILQRQQQLPTVFFTDEVRYELGRPAAPGEPPRRFYSLILSRAGFQSFSFRVSFMCAAAQDIAATGVPQCSSVWVLADAPLYEDAPSGGYAGEANGLIGAALQTGVPVYVIAGQFEKYGKIRVDRGLCSIERDVYGFIKERIVSAMPNAAGCAVLPVQIYGGLSYRSAEPDGTLVFGENTFGAMSAYKPEGCHIPLLYAMERINTGLGFTDNEIVAGIRALNRAQRGAFAYSNIETGD